MTMGVAGMGDMGEMGMKNPPNSIPMMGAEGPFGYITMGGLFTVLKVRGGITSYEDPGPYQHPPGTVADVASAADLTNDGIKVESPARSASTSGPQAEAWCGPQPSDTLQSFSQGVTGKIVMR
jgi:hypothetical protein